MRRVLLLLAALVLVGLVLLPVLRPADPVGDGNRGVVVTSHRAAYAVDARGTLRAAETVTVDLEESRAGLERRFDLRDPGSDRAVREPRDVTVTRDGQAEEVRLDHEPGVVVARLGDHDRALTGEHVYELRWTVPGVLAPASDADERARLRLDVLPSGWGTSVLGSRTSLELPSRPVRVECRAGADSCRPRVGAASVGVTTGSTAAGVPVAVDVLLDGDAPEVARLPWPLRLVPALGERWWPPVVVLLLTALTSYAGARLAVRPRPRRTRLVVLGAVLLTGVAWLLAPWTLVLLVPGAFAATASPVLLPSGARTTREQPAG